MCNGLSIDTSGFYRLEPRDTEAAEEIAALVMQKIGLDIRPDLRGRIEACLTITNAHRDVLPCHPAEKISEGIDARECEVILIVDGEDICEIKNVSIPHGLLAIDHSLA